MQTTTTPAARPTETATRPGRPGLTSAAMMRRNGDWLAMKDLGWSFARISAHVKMSLRAVKAGVAAAREARESPTNADALIDAGLDDIYELPEYRSDPAVREWLMAERGKRR